MIQECEKCNKIFSSADKFYIILHHKIDLEDLRMGAYSDCVSEKLICENCYTSGDKHL